MNDTKPTAGEAGNAASRRGLRWRPGPGELPGEVAAWFRGLSPGRATAMGLGLAVCVGIGDRLTGSANFTLLYLGPIAFGTWFVGLRSGLVLSAASAGVSFAADLGTPAAPSPAVMAWNLLVQLGVFVALALLLDALRARLIFEQQAARTDPLTGIANRRDFLESAEVELERVRRHLRPVTVAYLDLDDLKLVNDQFGHVAGDAVLATVATTLRQATRAVDSVARLGGDEFGLLLPETDGPTAETLVQRLQSTLAEAVQARGWPVTFSLGVVTFQRAPRSVDEMIGRADELMYQAKRAGKGGVRLEVVARAAADRPANLGY
ncbi:MAG TPA: GGDEF domain-containing protein [Anaeromyxobacteraceae bacterium]|nr:GGDEF domain-containing protein [Anaeromyxobacteraceae bacterium]